VNLVTPKTALDALRVDFPAAHMTPDYGNYRDFTIVGYVFRVSGLTNARTKLYAVNYGGMVDLDRVRLWGDCQAYARFKRSVKAANKRARVSA
jgi:hypothetical protein